jgi:hypothetical protein
MTTMAGDPLCVSVGAIVRGNVHDDREMCMSQLCSKKYDLGVVSYIP